MAPEFTGSCMPPSDHALGHRRKFLRQAGTLALAASGIPLLAKEAETAGVEYHIRSLGYSQAHNIGFWGGRKLRFNPRRLEVC